MKILYIIGIGIFLICMIGLFVSIFYDEFVWQPEKCAQTQYPIFRGKTSFNVILCCKENAIIKTDCLEIIYP